MRIIYILLFVCTCEVLNAQNFYHTDNLLLSQITKREYHKNYKRAKKSFVEFFDGKKHSSKKDSLIDSYIKEQWEEYINSDEFGWGYYELDANVSKYRYIVVIDGPINEIAYLVDEENQVDYSTFIEGCGILTKNNIYFTRQEYDCDESVHLNWYLIIGDQMKHIGELEEISFDYRNIYDSNIPGSFADNKGNFYCAIENKSTFKRKYYVIRFVPHPKILID